MVSQNNRTIKHGQDEYLRLSKTLLSSAAYNSGGRGQCSTALYRFFIVNFATSEYKPITELT